MTHHDEDRPETGQDGYGDLYGAVYEMLRGRAHWMMSSEAVGHTLQPTALVHEAFLKLADTDAAEWVSRSHFLAVATRAMRQVLIDYARYRSREKRGSGWCRITLQDDAISPDGDDTFDILELIHLDRALRDLEAQHERMGRVVEMKIFGGMTMDEIAEHLEVSKRTAEGDWFFARRWLRTALAEHDVGRGVAGRLAPEAGPEGSAERPA